MSSRFRRGEIVVYKKQKVSPKPGPRAHDIAPAVQDGKFAYVVDKFWVVTEVRDDGKIMVRTRRGKQHCIDPLDPNLRRVGWWDRLWNRSEYRKLLASVTEADAADRPA
jgi:hypothetical protein